MKLALLISALALLAIPHSFAEESAEKERAAKKLAAEERKRNFDSLKKELEAFKPAADAERDEMLVYLQQVFDASSKFAKANPQTAEAFEAASSGARQMAGQSHPKSGELAQIALDVAPLTGVDPRQVAVCWLLVANGKAAKNEFADARTALDKMKDIAPDLHALAMKQLDDLEKKAKKE